MLEANNAHIRDKMPSKNTPAKEDGQMKIDNNNNNKITDIELKCKNYSKACHNFKNKTKQQTITTAMD